MAAAVLPSSRGLATVRTSKSLVLIFFLLSLVHVATSLIDQDTLQGLKRDLQTLEEDVARKKANHILDKAFVAEIMDDLESMMDAMLKMTAELLSEFTPVSELVKDFKGFFDASKTFFAKMYEDEAALIKDNKEKLRGLKEWITSQEEHPAEL